jgi:hypothetical protein
MAELGDMTLTLRAKDEVSPVLRGISRQVWQLAHPRLALALIASGWGAFGFTAALLLVAVTGGHF